MGGAQAAEKYCRGWQRQAAVGEGHPCRGLGQPRVSRLDRLQGQLGQDHPRHQTAHTMFSDMPQGDHKKRAKYRFASKTLMRILPTSLKSEVEGLIEKKAITLDLYEILGQCTWGQKAAEK